MGAVFNKQYDRWQEDCKDEYDARFGQHYDDIEFSEDGSAYSHGMGGVNWVPRAVTPWEESEHYVHWSR